MIVDPNTTPYKLTSEIAELIKTLNLTPHAGTKLSHFEMHLGLKSQHIGFAIRIPLRNSGFAFISSPKIYCNCRPTQQSDFAAYYKSYWFFDIENPETPKNPNFV